MLERCELTDLIKDQCAHCLGHKTTEEEQHEENAEMLKSLHDWAK